MAGFPRLKGSYDIVVSGGGHAGLQAGAKSALLGQSAAVVDRGPKYSRSYYAPRMDNIPGFPKGISGHKLLDEQIAQVRALAGALDYVTPATVTAIERAPDGTYTTRFDWLKRAHATNSRVVILALGVVDRILEVGGKIDPIFPWANQGIVDFCLLCDGHRMADRTVAVLGHDAFAARTALDLLHFRPRSVELLTHGRPFLEGSGPAEREEIERTLGERGIVRREGVIVGFDRLREKRFGVTFADGTELVYDQGFSALGWYTMHAEVPRALGARFDPDGYVVTDEDCRVLSAETGGAIPGLYCVGDLRNGWNQIPEAWATAERAVIHAYASYL